MTRPVSESCPIGVLRCVLLDCPVAAPEDVGVGSVPEFLYGFQVTLDRSTLLFSARYSPVWE